MMLLSVFEANPGGAPCNVLAMLSRLGYQTAFIGKVGDDCFGQMLGETVRETGISDEGLVYDQNVNTTLALVNTLADGDRDFSFYRNPGADILISRCCKDCVDKTPFKMGFCNSGAV